MLGHRASLQDSLTRVPSRGRLAIASPTAPIMSCGILRPRRVAGRAASRRSWRSLEGIGDVAGNGGLRRAGHRARDRLERDARHGRRECRGEAARRACAAASRGVIAAASRMMRVVGRGRRATPRAASWAPAFDDPGGAGARPACAWCECGDGASTCATGAACVPASASETHTRVAASAPCSDIASMTSTATRRRRVTSIRVRPCTQAGRGSPSSSSRLL